MAARPGRGRRHRRTRLIAVLCHRVIPCLDVADGRVVKGVRFTDLRDKGDPTELAARYDHEGADEVVLLDITASSEGRKTMLEVVRKSAEVVFIPLTVGGGIRSVADVRRTLKAGADKVAINTAAVRDPSLLREGARQFGAQCIVVAIDARRVGDRFVVFTHGGRRQTDLDAVAWAAAATKAGAGEILLTSMDRDGTVEGFDLPLCDAVCQAVDVPVIASGGAGSAAHFCEVFERTDVAAALAASVFHDAVLSVSDVKEAVARRHIAVRRTPRVDATVGVR